MSVTIMQTISITVKQKPTAQIPVTHRGCGKCKVCRCYCPPAPTVEQITRAIAQG